jgi:hypothetical protein
MVIRASKRVCPASRTIFWAKTRLAWPSLLERGDDIEQVVEHGGLQVFGLYGSAPRRYDMLFGGQGLSARSPVSRNHSVRARSQNLR